ncbi:outer membrane protein assembly factor BamC [Rhodopseudomonas palustris]|uniref:Outer membrane protein assembly factor BamC n=2 Tax=Thiospirillum jenense TaxID=1653858 RepID=A0A839H2V2_9GAMM|nr:outer membrane protein assembly factor BamC [Rhodopseudomonas palustris]MBB1124773.1 outer membrane protein assembly factor BamC [Thiospirillum jenense]
MSSSRAHFLLVYGLLLGLAGCSSTQLDQYLPDQRLQYQKQTEARENLELPPDLTAVNFDDALDIPAANGTATYSNYTSGRAQQTTASAQSSPINSAVLPMVAGVTLARSGDKRWLVIQASPQRVWPQLITFWRQQGILLLEQSPTTGIIKTDWIENRADIQKDMVTNLFRKVVDGMYSSGTRDQYRVRLDTGNTPETSEIFLTHHGMQERLVNNALGQDTNSIWEPSASDPDKEVAMMRRLMLHLGVNDQRARQLLTAAPGNEAAAASELTTAPSSRSKAQLTVTNERAELLMPQPFADAWRRVGLALDRTGFAVADRDRSKGIFFVRYDDPNREPMANTGLTSRLAFWKETNKDRKVEQYQVRLVEQQGGATRVTVHDANGAADTTTTAGRILGLVEEALR